MTESIRKSFSSLTTITIVNIQIIMTEGIEVDTEGMKEASGIADAYIYKYSYSASSVGRGSDNNL